MRKLPSKHSVYDVIHQGAVFVLASWAVFGTFYATYAFGNFFVYGRPKLKEKYAKMKEEQLAKEQEEREAVLLEEQKKAEAL